MVTHNIFLSLGLRFYEDGSHENRVEWIRGILTKDEWKLSSSACAATPNPSPD